MKAIIFFAAFAAAQAAIEQVHTAYGHKESELSVAWATQQEGGTSEVHYGTSPDRLNRVNKGDSRVFTVDYNRKWYTKTAMMTNLTVNTQYYYKVGDSTNGFSKVFNVWNRRTKAPYRHILFGDMGASCAFTLCTACTRTSSVCNAEKCRHNTSVGLVGEVPTADMFLHVGDFAYNMGSNDGKTGDQFMNNIEQIAGYVPYMVSHGNHENLAPSLAHYIESFRSQPSNAVPDKFETRNGVTTNTMYFSWDYGLVHYISFSTELYHGITSRNPVVNKETFMRWLKDDLEKANRNRHNSPWILIHGHRPLYSSALDNSGSDLGLRRELEDVLFEYGVDFAVNGHQHDYERSWPTYKEKSQTNYNNPTATIYSVSGAAGSIEMHTPYNRPPPSWSAFRSNTFGYTRMIVHNASHIHWQQVQTDPTDFPLAQYGRVIDDVWIVQHNHGPFKRENAPKETPQGMCQTIDHFEPFFGDIQDGSGRPLHELLAEYKQKNGEKAWLQRLDKVLVHMNRNVNTTKIEWEDGNLSEEEVKLYQWIHHDNQ